MSNVRHPATQRPAGIPPRGPRPPAQVGAGYGYISLRDYFAANALAGMLSDQRNGSFCNRKLVQEIAEIAYEHADAMLAERQKGGAT